MIPAKTRTYFALRKARQTLIRAGISRFPVDPTDLYRLFGWGLFSLSDACKVDRRMEAFLSPGQEAKTYRCRRTGMHITVFDADVLFERLRWTLAHEAGHILMEHCLMKAALGRPLTKHEYEVLEGEANKFASELLAPAAVLNALGIREPEAIRSLCGLSREASKIRARELEWYADRPITLESASELRQLFHNYILERSIDFVECSSGSLSPLQF